MAEIARLISGMPMAEYQSLPAMSAGGVHTLTEECPALFWWGSPWNPNRPAENAAHFDVGTALHLAVLEPALLAERVVLITEDRYRTKAARDMRDEAWATGRIPLRPDEWATVQGMAAAIGADQEIAALFRGGEAETTLIWDWDGVPCKARPDYLSADRKTIVDAKTAISANPNALGRKAYIEGWYLRVPWYREAVAAVTGVTPERYVFVVVEKDEPYLTEGYELDERAITSGELAIRHGLRLFERCRTLGDWPRYAKGIAKLSLPTWAEYQLADREQAGEFSREKADIAARMMAP